MPDETPDSQFVTDADIPLPPCGLVMPIASMGEAYPESHWQEVKGVITATLKKAGYAARLVSDDDASGVIHNRIVKNLYSDDLVICDVSGRNPNVMFELGVRLAFDRPTIIVKDDGTQFSFDVNLIEHVAYSKSLRPSQVQDFQDRLLRKIQGTAEAAKNPAYSTFLKSIGGIVPSKVEPTEVPPDDYLRAQLEQIGARLEILMNTNSFERVTRPLAGLHLVLVVNWRSEDVAEKLKFAQFLELVVQPFRVREVPAGPIVKFLISAPENMLFAVFQEVAIEVQDSVWSAVTTVRLEAAPF